MTDTASNINEGRRGRLAALPALLVTGVLLGLNLNTAKAAITLGAPPAPFLLLSIAGAAVILWLVVLVRQELPVLDRAHIGYGLWSGLLSVALPNTTLFLAIPHVGAVLLGASKIRLDPAALVWIVVTLCVPLVVATGNIYRTRRWPKGASSLQLAPLMLTGSALWIGLYVAAVEPQHLATALSTGLTTLVLPVQIVMFAMMYVMYFVLQRIAGPVYFSQIGSVGAVMGAAMAVVWFREPLPAATLPAAILIGFGIGLVTLAQRTRR
jgi:drug/metabolite transporter (DMT)-like permease